MSSKNQGTLQGTRGRGGVGFCGSSTVLSASPFLVGYFPFFLLKCYSLGLAVSLVSTRLTLPWARCRFELGVWAWHQRVLPWPAYICRSILRDDRCGLARSFNACLVAYVTRHYRQYGFRGSAGGESRDARQERGRGRGRMSRKKGKGKWRF